jgi:hypothetical protein
MIPPLRAFQVSSKALPKDTWFGAVGPWAPACAGVRCERATKRLPTVVFAGDDKVGELGFIFSRILSLVLEWKMAGSQIHQSKN